MQCLARHPNSYPEASRQARRVEKGPSEVLAAGLVERLIFGDGGGGQGLLTIYTAVARGDGRVEGASDR
jgi:hypothetical protein